MRKLWNHSNPSIFIVLLMSILVFSCKETAKVSEIDVREEIENLNSLAEREKFLESVYKTDQEIRNGRSSEILLEYGQNSPEMQDFVSEMDSIDRLNLKRIDIYLKKFGYPDLDSVSQNANFAPWLVVQHSTNLEDRKEFFPVFYQAYKNKNLHADQFEMYLGRTYQMEFGEYPSWDEKYVIADKINRIITELDLNNDLYDN